MLNKHTDGKAKELKNKIEKIHTSLTRSNKAEVQSWLKTDVITIANKSLKKTLYLRTILSRKEEENLLDFYYPSNLIRSKESLSIDALCKSNLTEPIVISGTVGQGKSIALRYLCFYTLCKSERIPIFLELRKLSSTTSLVEHVKEKLDSVSLPCSVKLVNRLLSVGKLSLMLDGFDELKHKQREYWVTQIENLHNKYSKTSIFVTTRPNTEIHQHHLFKNYELELLGPKDRKEFIQKLVKNNEDQEALITKLEEASENVEALLRTPLLMSLFVSVYNNRRKLPNSDSEFFDELFSTLLTRHDGLKVAYDRPTKSGLNDKELKTALQALCYQTRKESLRQFNDIEIQKLSSRSLNVIDFDSGLAEAFVSDVCNITCLLLRDGVEYRFIHDSVQEYFSACFVRAQEETKSEFYSKYLDDWHHWNSELNFLMYIDKIGYTKYFLVPSLKKLCDVDDKNKILRYKKSSLTNLLESSLIIFTKKLNEQNYKLLCLETRDFTRNWANYLICKFDLQKNRLPLEKNISKLIKQNMTKGANILGKIKTHEAIEILEGRDVTFVMFNALEFLNRYDLVSDLYDNLNSDALYDIQKELDQAYSYLTNTRNIGKVF